MHDVQEEAQHTGGLKGWAESHKWIVGGLGVAVVLGLYAARRNSQASPSTGITIPDNTDTGTTGGGSWLTGGVVTPPVVIPPIPPITVNVPPVPSIPPIVIPSVPSAPISSGITASGNSGSSNITVGASLPATLAPTQTGTHTVPIATGPNAGQLTTVSNVSTWDNPGLGSGGGNYYTGSAQDKADIAYEQQQLAAGNVPWIQSQITYTNQVISNREAAGLNISDQTDYLNQLNTALNKTKAPTSSATAPSGALGSYSQPSHNYGYTNSAESRGSQDTGNHISSDNGTQTTVTNNQGQSTTVAGNYSGVSSNDRVVHIPGVGNVIVDKDTALPAGATIVQ